MRTSVDAGMATFPRGQQARHATTAKGDFGSLLDIGPAPALPARGEREPVLDETSSARGGSTASTRQPAPRAGLAAAHPLPVPPEASPDSAITPEFRAAAIAEEPAQRRGLPIPVLAGTNDAAPLSPDREDTRGSAVPPDDGADEGRGDIGRASAGTQPPSRESLTAASAGIAAVGIAPENPSPRHGAGSPPPNTAGEVKAGAQMPGQPAGVRPIRAEATDSLAVGETPSASPDLLAERQPARSNREPAGEPASPHAASTATPPRGAGNISREAVEAPARPAAPTSRRKDMAEHQEPAAAPPLAQVAQAVTPPRQTAPSGLKDDSTDAASRPIDTGPATRPTAPPMSMQRPRHATGDDRSVGRAAEPAPGLEGIGAADTAPTMPSPPRLAPAPHRREPTDEGLPAMRPEAGRSEHVAAAGPPLARSPAPSASSSRSGSARLEETADDVGPHAPWQDTLAAGASGQIEAAGSAPAQTLPTESPARTGSPRRQESANGNEMPVPQRNTVAARTSDHVEALGSAPPPASPAASTPRTGSARQEESANAGGEPASRRDTFTTGSPRQVEPVEPPVSQSLPTDSAAPTPSSAAAAPRTRQVEPRPEADARPQAPALARSPGNAAGSEASAPRDTHVGQPPPLRPADIPPGKGDAGQHGLRASAPGAALADPPSSRPPPSGGLPDTAAGRSADKQPETRAVPRANGLEQRPLMPEPESEIASPAAEPSAGPAASKPAQAQTQTPLSPSVLSSMVTTTPASPPRSPGPSDPADAGPHRRDAEAAGPQPGRMAEDEPLSVAAPAAAAKPSSAAAGPPLNETPRPPVQAPSGPAGDAGTTRRDVHAVTTDATGRPAAAPAPVEPPRDPRPVTALPPSHAVDAAPASADKPGKPADGSAGFAAELTVAVAKYTLPAARQDDAEPLAPTISVASPGLFFADKVLTPPSPANALASAIAAEPSWRPLPVAGMTQSATLRTAAPSQTLQIQLNPDRLGIVTATLTLSGAQLTVELAATTQEAHERLKGEEHVIEKAIRGLGYDVGQVSITQSMIAANAPARPETAASAPPSPQRDQASGGGAMSSGDGQSRDQRGGRNGNDGSGAYHGSSPRDPDRRRGGVYI